MNNKVNPSLKKKRLTTTLILHTTHSSKSKPRPTKVTVSYTFKEPTSIENTPPKNFTTDIITTWPTHSIEWRRTPRPYDLQSPSNKTKGHDTWTQSSKTSPNTLSWKSGHPPRIPILDQYRFRLPLYELETNESLREWTDPCTWPNTLRVTELEGKVRNSTPVWTRLNLVVPTGTFRVVVRVRGRD